MSRKPQLRSAALAAALLISLFLVFRSCGSVAGSRSAAGPVVLDAPAPRSRSTPLPPVRSEGVEPAECAALVQETDQLAREAAKECATRFALTGLCPPPLGFPLGQEPARQLATVDRLFGGCDLSPDQLLVDCEEYPCITLVSSRALSASASCPGMDLVRRRSQGRAAGVGGVWGDWIPMIADDLDLEDQVRATLRFPNRSETLARRLASRGRAPDQREVPTDCGHRAAMLDRLKTPELRCDAVRELWGCPVDVAPVGAEQYDDYVSYGQSVLDRLIDECPHVTQENVVLDCSSAPCLLGVDIGDQDLGNASAFCRLDGLHSFTSTWRAPWLRVAVLYLGKRVTTDAEARERMEQEGAVRLQQMIDEWPW